MLIAITDFYNDSNGLAISTHRFIECFRKHGHEVRVLTNSKSGNPDYPLEVFTIPIIDGIVKKEGYTFAKIQKDVIEEAVDWCDIVHVEDPFGLGRAVIDCAKKRGKPATATFHLYPENMSYGASIHWMHIEPLMMAYFRRSFKYADFIQCPTEPVKERLVKCRYKNRMVVVSNGINVQSIQKQRHLKPEGLEGKFIVLSIGRYSKEKNQIEILRAVRESRHKKDIKVILLGKGPFEQRLVRYAMAHSIDVDFGFKSQEELKEIRSFSDIYIHSSIIEIEGMACMESFASGVVPVIAKSRLSSTSIYSLSENNTYRSGDVHELARKIDYWFEHREEIESYRKSIMI